MSKQSTTDNAVHAASNLGKLALIVFVAILALPMVVGLFATATWQSAKSTAGEAVDKVVKPIPGRAPADQGVNFFDRFKRTDATTPTTVAPADPSDVKGTVHAIRPGSPEAEKLPELTAPKAGPKLPKLGEPSAGGPLIDVLPGLAKELLPPLIKALPR